MTQARIQKWGNSLAVRIPKSFAEEVGLENNTLVTVSIEDGKLLLAPATPSYLLEDLLAEITRDNLHIEVETGDPVGNEAW